MRAVAILLAAFVAVATVQTHHVRRAQPHATIGAQAPVHYHHARSHRSPAALPDQALVAARDTATRDQPTTTPTIAIDRAPTVLVARGPPA